MSDRRTAEDLPEPQGAPHPILAYMASLEKEMVAARQQIAALQQEKESDGWHRGWKVAVEERDIARRQLDKQKAALLALVERLIDRHVAPGQKEPLLAELRAELEKPR